MKKMKNVKQLPRGLRNRNPLNIRKSDQLWLGQTGNDGAFCIFVSNEYGYRAAFKILKTYNTKYHIYSVREIISKWAPPSDGNNTRGYIERVCQLAGLRETDTIVADTNDVEQQEKVKQLVQAMACVENGCAESQIDRDEIDEGYALAVRKS
jgi:hypothetical protein